MGGVCLAPPNSVIASICLGPALPPPLRGSPSCNASHCSLQVAAYASRILLRQLPQLSRGGPVVFVERVALTPTAVVADVLSSSFVSEEVDHAAGAQAAAASARVCGGAGAWTGSMATCEPIDCSGKGPTECGNLKREPCFATSKTCGACLAEYEGEAGDSNEACSVSCARAVPGFLSLSLACKWMVQDRLDHRSWVDELR